MISESAELSGQNQKSEVYLSNRMFKAMIKGISITPFFLMSSAYLMGHCFFQEGKSLISIKSPQVTSYQVQLFADSATAFHSKLSVPKIPQIDGVLDRGVSYFNPESISKKLVTDCTYELTCILDSIISNFSSTTACGRAPYMLKELSQEDFFEKNEDLTQTLSSFFQEMNVFFRSNSQLRNASENYKAALLGNGNSRWNEYLKLTDIVSGHIHTYGAKHSLSFPSLRTN